MIRQRKFTGKIVTVLFFVMIVSLVVLKIPIFNTKAATNHTVTWDTVSIENEYLMGHQLMLPSVNATVNGQAITARPYTYYPDGRAYNSTLLNLDVAGNYKVEYRITYEGKPYTTEKQIKVFQGYYELSGSKEQVELSSAQYGLYAPEAQREGIMFSLAEGVSIKFNKTFDFSNMTANDPLLELFVVPQQNKSLDFELLRFVFTDVDDADNTLTFTLRSDPGGVTFPTSWAMVAGKGQSLTGREKSRNLIHVGNTWGTWVVMSFVGNYGSNNVGSTLDKYDTYVFSPRINYSTKEFYAGNDNFVADLDSTEFFGKLWNGFNNGKAKLEIFAEGFVKSSANFVISSMAGHNAADFDNNLINDNVPPSIEIDDQGYTTFPIGKTGVEYKVFNASANDESGVREVNTRVFYNYDNEGTRIEFPIYNGKITPAFSGEYAVEYSAVDYFGNISKVVRKVTVKDKIDNLFVIADTTAAVKSGLAGNKIPIAQSATSGGSGKAVVLTEVRDKDGIIHVEDGFFQPIRAGSYTVTYTATDHIGQIAMLSYVVEIDRGDGPLFEGELTFEKTYIKGYTYTMPKHTAIDYTSGEAKISSYTVTVKEADGTLTNLDADRKYTFKTDSSEGEITVTYKSGESQVSYVLNVANVKNSNGSLDISKYFDVSEGVTATPHSDYIQISAVQDGSAEFIKSQLVENFTMQFSAVIGKNKFTNFDVILTDSVDHTQSIRLEYVKMDSGTDVRLGAASAHITSVFGDTNNRNFEFKISNNVIWVSEKSGLIPTKTISGETFKGFESDLIYVTIIFRGVTGTSAINIERIHNQLTTNIALDLSRPRIKLYGEYGGEKNINQDIIIPRAIAVDVLDPNTTITVSVYDAKNQYIKDINGKELKDVDISVAYTVRFTQFGSYNVRYLAKDSNNGNPESFQYVIRVVDSEPPVLTFNKQLKDIKVGDIVSLPNYTVSDNFSPEDKITVKIFLYTPDGRLLMFENNSNSFKASLSGSYKILYMAQDENYNTSYTWLYVTAK